MGEDALVDAATILGTLIAAATFMLVISDWTKLRHRSRPVVWFVDSWGFGTTPRGERGRTLSISNGGREPAVMSFLGFANAELIRPTDRAVKKWLIMPGESIDLMLRDKEFDKAWVLISWIEPSDTRFTHNEWHPLMTGTDLEREQLRQAELQTTSKGHMRKPIPSRKPLGPQGWWKTVERRSEQSKESRTESLKILSTQHPLTLVFPTSIEQFGSFDDQESSSPTPQETRTSGAQS
jgi:hypothetical protein